MLAGSSIAIAGISLFVIMLVVHVPLAFALMGIGFVAFGFQAGFGAGLAVLSSETSQVLENIDFSAVPLFLIMSAFVTMSGLSKDLFVAAAALLGHRRGALSYATITGSAVFGAVCGSSPATVATFTRVALPEMLARGYSPGFAGATIAAGGALKSLIPPSVTMIIYCVIAKVFIFDLFSAAILPAILAIALNLAAIAITVRLFPGLAPVGGRLTWSERMAAIGRASPAILLILIIFAGLYSGVFTVNEAASVAAVTSFVFAVLRRRVTFQTFNTALAEAAVVVGMLYFVLIGSAVFVYFVNIAHIPEQLVEFIGSINLPPVIVVIALLVGYLVLGAVFDEMAAMIVTLPFVLPIIVSLGYEPIWWGIINVIIIELGMMIPPIGIVILIVNGMAPQIPLKSLYKGVAPFIIADIFLLAIIVAFPGLVLLI